MGQYDALLSFLKSHGALLNAVKPELLLDIEEFRSGLTAGSGHQSLTKGLPGMTWCAVTQPRTASAQSSSQPVALAGSSINPCFWQIAVQP